MTEILDIADSAAKKHLEKLKKLGVIEKVGSTRGYWRVNL
jgi:ATP-dependent DNA helicase RecG